MRIIPTSVLAFVLLGACASAPPVSAEELAQAESRLLEPFRQGRAIYGNTIEIVISPNFYDQIVLPATSRKLHEMQRNRDGGDDVYRWLNKAGGVQAPLMFKIADTEIAAEQVATLRVLGSGKAMTCQVEAGGSVIEAPQRGALRGWKEYRIADGLVQRR